MRAMRHIAIQPAEVRRHAHSARAPAFAPGVRAPELRGRARASRFSTASGCGARKSRTQNVRIRENDCSGDARTTTSGALVNGRGDLSPVFAKQNEQSCFANALTRASQTCPFHHTSYGPPPPLHRGGANGSPPCEAGGVRSKAGRGRRYSDGSNGNLAGCPRSTPPGVERFP